MWAYKDFSEDFLKRHHSLVLLMTMHKIRAFFLYPPQECCQSQCPCHVSRRHIVLSLNLNLYHQEKKKWLKKGKAINGSSLHEIAHLLGIPDENGLLEEWKEGIPLWLIEKDFNDQHRQQDFKRTGAMTWTLLRLKHTYARSWWREPRATISEALSILIGEAALKKENKARWMTYAEHLGGEKAYTGAFRRFRSLCHLITAYFYIIEQKGTFLWDDPKNINDFLNTSACLRTMILGIQTNNIRQQSLFLHHQLLSLPSWVQGDKGLNSPIIIEPFEDRQQQIDNDFAQSLQKVIP